MPPRQQRPGPASSPEELVDPTWLVRAFGVVLVLALLCAYLALGFLFWQGAWQLVLHPSHDTHMPAAVVLGAESVRFFPSDAGEPQIAGQWLPPVAAGPLSSYTFLVCRSGTGQLGVDDRPTAAMLASTGAAALFFDYRGFGPSSPGFRPSEASMQADAASAWTYLSETRRIAPDHILPYGLGLGSLMASRLALQHPEIPALILRNADASAFDRVLSDPRGRMFPARLLLHDRYDVAGALALVKQPKLLLSVGQADSARGAAYQAAPEPKTTVELPIRNSAQERDALLRFTGDHLP